MSSHKPIRTGLLSYGMSGEVFHAPLLSAHQGFTIMKILERTKDKARQHYPDVKTVRSITDILQDDEIELVIVNTPHDTHVELATQVLEAGKHAIIEKPFTNTVAEGKKLISLAAKNKVMLSVFQNRRWDGDFMTVKSVVESGVLGRIVEFEAHYDRYRPAVDHTTWKEASGPGSGILYNLGAHMIDQALVLFGTPILVDARVGIQRQGGIGDDFYDIRMQYDALQVILKSSYLVREPGPRYMIYGETGSFIKYGLDPQEQALKERQVPGRPGWGVESREWWGKLNAAVHRLNFEGRIETTAGNYMGFYDNIFRAIREGKPLEVTADQALNVIRIIELAKESSQERRAVKAT